MPQSNNYNKKLYDDLTMTFESICGRHLHVGYYKNNQTNMQSAAKALTSKLCDIVESFKPKKILDIGCGIGGPAEYFATRLSAQVTGITNSKEGIRRATSTNSNVNYLELDAHQLIGSNLNGFDFALMIESSHLMSDKQSLFQGVHKVCTHSSGLLLCDFVLKENPELNYSKDKQRQMLLMLRDVKRTFGNYFLCMPEQLKAMVRSAGFKYVQTLDITKEITPTFRDWSSGARQTCGIPATTLDRFVKASDCMHYLFEQNMLGYTVLVGHKVERGKPNDLTNRE